MTQGHEVSRYIVSSVLLRTLDRAYADARCATSKGLAPGSCVAWQEQVQQRHSQRQSKQASWLALVMGDKIVSNGWSVWRALSIAEYGLEHINLIAS
jgi:hypothetical protein